jgi:hypothetical protein
VVAAVVMDPDRMKKMLEEDYEDVAVGEEMLRELDENIDWVKGWNDFHDLDWNYLLTVHNNLVKNDILGPLYLFLSTQSMCGVALFQARQ